MKEVYLINYPLYHFPSYFIIAPQRYTSTQASEMLMEDLVDSGDDSEFGDSDSIYTCFTSSSSPTESESDANSVDETAVDQLPRKRVRTRGGLAFRPTRNPIQAASATPLVDPQRDDLIDASGHPVINQQNVLPVPSVADSRTSTNQWKDQPNVVKKINFTGVPGLKVDMARKKPIDFFNLFVTDELINTMISETNRYANQEIDKHRPLKRSSRLKDWKPINADDMRNFLGILLHMGCVKLPSFGHYWSTNELYRFSAFSKVMSRNKFQLMLRFWHFVDNENAPSTRLSKIMLLVDQLNNTMATIYTPDRKVSIDESMMLWRGRLIFRQYIKNKKHKYGVKFYELCESDGIVMNVKIYSGEPTPDIHSLGQTGAIVLHLMENLLGKGYELYTDNFYNSFELAKHMLTENTYICGTLRNDRKSNPKEVTKAKLKKGDVVSRSRDGVIVTKWKDKRDVLMISNMHTHEMIEVSNRRGEKKMKPTIIRDYNAGMSGIDRADQMVSYYDCLRKTTRWYKKIALHIFDIFVFNAYCLNTKYGIDKSMTLLKYREAIITDFIGDRVKATPPSRTNNMPNLHYITAIPPTEKKRLPTKPCRVCSKEKRKETRYECTVCREKPSLCVGECFKVYHTKE